MTDDRGQRTDDSGLMTEDGGKSGIMNGEGRKKWEGGKWNAEFGMRKVE